MTTNPLAILKTPIHITILEYLERSKYFISVEGKTHQGMSGVYPLSRNSQCTAVSACALAHVCALQCTFQSHADVDKVLADGYHLYLDIRRTNNNQFLASTDLPPQFSINGSIVELVDNTPVWMGCYPLSSSAADISESLNHLTTGLEDILNRVGGGGFLFTGKVSTVAFWKDNDGNIYLFNSHAVNVLNFHDSDESANKARVFKCDSTSVLAALLLSTASFDEVNRYYGIDHITVRVVTEMEGCPSSSESDSDIPLAARVLPPSISLSAESDHTNDFCVVRPRKKRRFARKPEVTLHQSHTDSDSDLPLALRLVRDQVPVVTLDAEVVQSSDARSVSSSVCVATKKRRVGRPPKRKVGRAKTSALSKRERKAAANTRYAEKRKLKKLERDSTYQKDNPDKHRAAVTKYTAKHPQVNRATSATYNCQHPEVNRATRISYNERNPDVIRDSFLRFHENNSTKQSEYDRVRHLPPDLRSGPLVGTWRGQLLNEVLPYTLAQMSLRATDCSQCTHCGAKYFDEEVSRKKWCCDAGRLVCLRLPPLDADFYSHPDFLKKPGMYNSLYAMSVMCVKGGWRHASDGITHIKLQGKTYHLLYDGDRNPSAGRPNYTQTYIHDGLERSRQGEQHSLNQSVVGAIKNYLHDKRNPYVTLFRRLGEEPSRNATIVFRHVERRRLTNNFIDNEPQNEVASLLPTEDVPYERRQILVSRYGKGEKYLDVLSPYTEVLQYPLLFPTGQLGWSLNLHSADGKKITFLKYTRFMLLSEPRFSMFSRLSDTWLVDSYSRMEENVLRYIELGQKQQGGVGQFRIAPVEELRAVVAGRIPGAGTATAHEVGRSEPRVIADDETIQGEGGASAGRVYLPASFVGSKRYYRTRYLDAMAVVTRKGNVHYFLTITSSGSWPEHSASRTGANTEAHIVQRVFKIKFDSLLRDLKSGRFFGKLVHILWVIEFQARGLPHAHLCFRVEDQHAPVQTSFIDQVVRADIPSHDECGGRLRELVLKHMIHGPCGPPHRTNLPCWDSEKGICKKRFPKAHNEVTFCDDKGFFHYRRNAFNTATRHVRGRPVVISDCHVVPYNAALLLRYDTHINLEVAASRRAIKYLYKYLTKGVPLTAARIDSAQPQVAINECTEYQTFRYLGASDVAWRVLEMDMTGRFPTCECLPVHLAERQVIRFRRGNESDALNNLDGRLEFYFDRPKVPELENITYCEFYERYMLRTSMPKNSKVPVWKMDGRDRWITPRQRGEMVCRLFWVSPHRGEQYFLRMLLAKFPCRGYADLLSVGGPGCSSFQEVARSLGLLENEKEYDLAITEANTFMMGYRLRIFFVTLLVVGAPGALLWERHANVLSEDLFEGEEDRSRAHMLALSQIDRGLRRSGSRNEDHGLPAVVDTHRELGRELLSFNTEELASYVSEWLPRLTIEQRRVYDYVMDLVEHHNPLASNGIFLDSPGGYGKTCLALLLAAALRSRRLVVLCTASSGLAASAYPHGCTAHAMFRYPLQIDDPRLVWGITNGSQRAELIRRASFILYDEISMCNKSLLTLLDKSLRDLMGVDRLFGGKAVMLTGDYRQLAPVVEGARTPSDVINVSLRSSPLWDQLKKFSLTVGQRCTDPNYSSFLLSVGDGRAEETVLPPTIPDTLPSPPVIMLREVAHFTEVAAAIDWVFPDVDLENPDLCTSRAFLCTHLINARDVNSSVLNRLTQPEHLLSSADYIDPSDVVPSDDYYEAELLHQSVAKGVPPHVLALKVGCCCIVTRNLNPDAGLLNGSKVIVVEIRSAIVVVRKAGSHELFAIPRIVFKFPVFPNSHVLMCRRQYPLQLAYALTVHKAQGQTISRCVLDLRSDCFGHGQLYVGLSRVRNSSDIRVLVEPSRIHDGKAYARNIVYRSLLQ